MMNFISQHSRLVAWASDEMGLAYRFRRVVYMYVRLLRLVYIGALKKHNLPRQPLKILNFLVSLIRINNYTVEKYGYPLRERIIWEILTFATLLPLSLLIIFRL